VLLEFVTAFSVVSGGFRVRLCNRPPQRIRVDVVDETPPAVDLDDRDPLPVRRLELGVAVDRDLAEAEAEFVPRRADDASRRLAEMAARRGVEDDLRYG
jgi:hypothetical protein